MACSLDDRVDDRSPCWSRRPAIPAAPSRTPFFGVAGTRVVVLYPEGQVSDVQEAQFTTLGGNVTAVAVKGTFDDCQRLAKEAFADAPLQSRVRLTSANSISLGRLLPQMFYYAYAALQYKAQTPLVISVPSGNFGNLVAGVMAWKMGAPINGFSAPTTINDTVPRYFAIRTGRAAPVGADLANAMDVGNPSNLERLQWLFDGDLAAMRKVISTASHTDDEVRGAIAELYKKYGYVADPHTAIGYLGAAEARRAAGAPCALFLATAHPAKFREVVEPVIGKPVPLPDALAETLARKKDGRAHRSDAWRVIEVVMIDGCPRQRPPRHPRSFPPANRSTRNTPGISARSSAAGTHGKPHSPSSTAASRPIRNTRARCRRARRSCCARCATATPSRS